MFWNKKENKNSLPDLPAIKSPFSKELFVSSQDKNIVEEKMEENAEPDDEKHSLPSFPDSLAEKGFSQTAIKEAVSQDEIKEPEESDSEEESDLPVAKPEQNKFKTIQVNEDHVSSTKENPYLKSVKTGLENKNKYVQPINTYNEPEEQEKPFTLGLPPSEPEFENEIEKPMPAENQKKGDVFVKIEKFYSAKKSLDGIRQQIDQIDDLLKKIRDIKMKEERELSVWEKEIALVKSRIQNVNETIFEKIS